MTTSPKKRPGRWKPGESGNPAGRTPGSGDVAKVRAAIAAHIPELLDAMMQRALDGDVGAARLLLERTVAPLKAAELAQPLGTLTEQGRAVMAAVSAGEMAPGQGAALVGALGALARVAEVDELAARVAELEKRHGKP